MWGKLSHERLQGLRTLPLFFRVPLLILNHYSLLLQMLKDDPEFADVFADIHKNGMGVSYRKGIEWWRYATTQGCKNGN